MREINSSSSYLKILVCAVSMGLVIIVRLGVDQVGNYQQGVANLQEGNPINSIIYFDRVLNAHIPFSPIEVKARKKILGLAVKFEQKKEYAQALLCYETMRSTMYLTRHFLLPFSTELIELNNKIAFLKATELVQEGAEGDFQSVYDVQRNLLERDFSPSVMWSTVAVVSFFSFVGLLCCWIVKKREMYAVLSLLSFVAWVGSLTCVS